VVASQAHIVSSLGTLCAFVTCMLISVGIAVAFCLIRFKLRQDRRRAALAKRAEDQMRWVRHRIRRALVLDQASQAWRMADNAMSSAEMLRDIRVAQLHAVSAMSMPLHAPQNSWQASGHVLCTCFRTSKVDNWLSKSTGENLYKAVHRQVSAPEPDGVRANAIHQEVDEKVARHYRRWANRSKVPPVTDKWDVSKLADEPTLPHVHIDLQAGSPAPEN
jgi:hypothetical protein